MPIREILNQSNAHRELMFRALKNVNYRRYYFAWGFSSIGTWMQAVAMGWLVYRLTHSPLLLGAVAFASQAPSIVLSPFAGVLSDRYDRRWLLFWAQACLMIQACLLAAVVLTGKVNTATLMGLGLFLGIVNAFELPIRQAFIKELIDDKNDLSNAIALNASAMNISKLLGPALAGILIALVGEGWCFTLNAFSFIPIVMVLLSLKLPRGQAKPGGNGSFLGELGEGFRYATRFSPIRALLLMLGIMSLLQGAFQTLMPVFVKEQYHTGPEAFGLIIGAAGIGAVGAALYLAGRQSIRGLWRHIGVALPGLGFLIMAFGYVHDVRLAAGVSFLVGFLTMMQVASTNSILQAIVEEDKRGRIMSLYGTVLIGAGPVGSVIAGASSGTLGLPLTFLIGGSLALVTTLIFWQSFARLRAKVLPIYIEKGIIAVEQ